MNILEISSLFLRGYCYGYLVTSDFQNGIKMTKKLTRFFYHEWLLDVVVEDWDIRPILLMHFLK